MPNPVQATAEGLPKITPAAAGFANLSFVSLKSPVRSYWNVKPTGEYGNDCMTGQELALEYLRFEASRPSGDCPNYLNLIAEDMPRPFDGLEVGFFTALTYALRAGAREAQRIVATWEAANTRLNAGEGK